jgi:hypothetical protein
MDEKVPKSGFRLFSGCYTKMYSYFNLLIVRMMQNCQYFVIIGTLSSSDIQLVVDLENRW